MCSLNCLKLRLYIKPPGFCIDYMELAGLHILGSYISYINMSVKLWFLVRMRTSYLPSQRAWWKMSPGGPDSNPPPPSRYWSSADRAALMEQVRWRAAADGGPGGGNGTLREQVRATPVGRIVITARVDPELPRWWQTEIRLLGYITGRELLWNYLENFPATYRSLTCSFTRIFVSFSFSILFLNSV